MTKLGVSPFMKLFQNKNLISACIIGCQYKTFEMLVKGSKIDEDCPLGEPKYILKDT